jgi:hypothetical protein
MPERSKGFALLMVLMICSSLLLIGMLFTSSVSCEYRSAVLYRRASLASDVCLAGMHRAMAELVYDVWGGGETVPFLTARYNPQAIGPEDNLLALSSPAYFETSAGSLKPLRRQRGFWNGEAWVVWAGEKVSVPAGLADPWNMDPRPVTRLELPGGAQRYLSYGEVSGKVSIYSGEKSVRAVGGAQFSLEWQKGMLLSIGGESCLLNRVASSSRMFISQPYPGPGGESLTWSVPGSVNCPGGPGADSALPGGTQSRADFLRSGAGYSCDPRWIDPGGFIARRCGPGISEVWRHGGVDLNGDGRVTASDADLRNWALWQLRRDAFLPEGNDNHDLFQVALHANNRHLRPNGPEPALEAGWEFIDPCLVGDSYYLIFRWDPLFSGAPEISGDPACFAGQRLDARSDSAGMRFPYDRTHLGRGDGVPFKNDLTGGLVNINNCNNDYRAEYFFGPLPAGASADDLLRYSYNEAKWIYCYRPDRPEERYGRYALTVLPDCGVWSLPALHNGGLGLGSSPSSPNQVLENLGLSSSYFSALNSGWDSRSGESAEARLLEATACSVSPVRPEPLPAYWVNPRTKSGASYYPPFDSQNMSQSIESFLVCDYSRVQEVAEGGTMGANPWADGKLGTALNNYNIWLGPHASRVELIAHLRKACLVSFRDSFSADNQQQPESRRSMAERDLRPSILKRIEADARMIADFTSIHGYSYELGRFWDRQLLVLDSGGGASGSSLDGRFSTAQSSLSKTIRFEKAVALPGQRTRADFLKQLRDLEYYGGYRTPDGSYRLLDFLFPGQRESFQPDLTDAAVRDFQNGRIPPGQLPARSRARRSMEKFMALASSRVSCMLRGENARIAACARGHLLRNPRVDSWHKSSWSGLRKSRGSLRAGISEAAVDDIADGCPVCGGRLFMAPLHELFINEIGRFRERFRNAERPVRQAFSLSQPELKPMRGFVELMTYGYPGYVSGINGSEDLARFDNLTMAKDRQGFSQVPAILCDSVSGAAYFTHRYDFDARWRSSSEDHGAMDPEPFFRELGNPFKRKDSQWDLRLLLYDDSSNNGAGAWHDIFHYLDSSSAYCSDSEGKTKLLSDPELFKGRFRMITDDSAARVENWKNRSLRLDSKYIIPDPDPAHQQAAEASGGDWRASVSVYRKIPVRLYGGDRKHPYDMEYERLSEDSPPLGVATSQSLQPGHLLQGRGLGFPDYFRLTFSANRKSGDLWRYRGDYSDCMNPAGWPSPFADDGVTRSWPLDETGRSCSYPRQYGVITFDGSFDGTRLALMRCSKAASRPKYSRWRLIDYVELTDSAGHPLRISSGAGKSDPLEAGRCLSWQVRNPLDNRSNADGHLCWDLLPMTLQNPEHRGALDPHEGYIPWRLPGMPEGASWWGNAAQVEQLDRCQNPNPPPPGYQDLLENRCYNRNLNSYVKDFPVARSRWRPALGASLGSSEARGELLVAHLDNSTRGQWSRESNRSDCAISIPTGVGRQCRAGNWQDPDSAGYSGRQHLLLSHLSWFDGADDGRKGRQWGGYSWNSWGDLWSVSDLCSLFIWDLGHSRQVSDCFDTDGDCCADQLRQQSLGYVSAGGAVLSRLGRYNSELKRIDRVNLNEVRFPVVLAPTAWQNSYASLGRKPLKGFHSPVDILGRDPGSGFEYRPGRAITTWDLDGDSSLDSQLCRPEELWKSFRGGHCRSSPVHTILLTGQALDSGGQPISEARLRIVVERTWDGRANILEFTSFRDDF